MFNYYGSKSKIAHLYPTPKFDKIIEPFAGSARYSLKHFEKDILLIDKYETVVIVWNWLKQCSPKDILSMPKLEVGLDLNTLNLSKEEKLFLGFFAGQGSLEPRMKVSPMAKHSFDTTPNRYKNIANNLFKIKHWIIEQGSYLDIPNQNATWFIDAPYQFGGEHYKCNNKNIDFNQLYEFSKSREGQVIVCENTKADWLPFKPIVKIQGVSNTNTTEVIWSNYETAFDYQMKSLFD